MAQVVVGLGNPGPKYRATRHNVGQWVVDRLAHRLPGQWERVGSARLYRSEWKGETLYLAKLSTHMNVSGPAVARLLDSLSFTPDALILIHDDIDLQLGKVRTRRKGKHGGHHGLQSVLEALGTEAVRRVKLGVGRPATKDEVIDFVLTEFEEDELPEIEAACERAADAALALVETPPSHSREES
jgi:PTH1 family peptidyl-tRNA hydrolase